MDVLMKGVQLHLVNLFLVKLRVIDFNASQITFKIIIRKLIQLKRMSETCINVSMFSIVFNYGVYIPFLIYEYSSIQLNK